MNKNNKQGGFSGIATIGIVAAVVVIVIMFGYFVMPKESEKDEILIPVADNTIQESVKEEGVTEEKEAVVTEDSTKTETVVKAGSYEAYSVDKLARAESGDVVLFFHASWCPSCRGLNKDIENNLASISGGVTILKTDYDRETELKKKYGVTYQHTLVQVDKDGNLIKKWSGSPSLDRLLAQIQ